MDNFNKFTIHCLKQVFDAFARIEHFSFMCKHLVFWFMLIEALCKLFMCNKVMMDPKYIPGNPVCDVLIQSSL